MGPLYGPITSCAPHRARSASSSVMDPLAESGTQDAQWAVASMANASSLPFGNINAMRSPRPNPSACKAGPKSFVTKSYICRCVKGARPSIPANAGCGGNDNGMAEANVGKRGEMTSATCFPLMEPLGLSKCRLTFKMGDSSSKGRSDARSFIMSAESTPLPLEDSIRILESTAPVCNKPKQHMFNIGSTCIFWGFAGTVKERNKQVHNP